MSFRKKYIEEFVWVTSLFWMHTLLSISLFIAFFIYSLHISKWHSCSMVPTKIHNIAMERIQCDYIMNERSKIWKSLKYLAIQHWLVGISKNMIYFRLCFSFRYSGYDLTLIKKTHALSFYSFFLLLVTVVVQFTAKTTNSEKAIYFLSLISCSISKLKSQFLFTCKSFRKILCFPI